MVDIRLYLITTRSKRLVRFGEIHEENITQDFSD